TQANYRENPTDIDTVMLPLDTNPRAKMLGIKDGFVKIFARRGSGSIFGGVVIGPRASELILPITMAVENRLTVDQLAASFVVYPSVSGSLTEAARKLHRHLVDRSAEDSSPQLSISTLLTRHDGVRPPGVTPEMTGRQT